ncbi:MAG: recombination-associated protein RdgC [Chromatiaceae bacterium]|jgi:recombination associated protein RdgC|nr:recombination-associated protein RdgC [Chromatiaceae bacterium]
MFKNVRFYQLDDAGAVLAEATEERLAERRFRPCGPLETATFGWTPPLGERAEALTHSGNGCLLLTARRQERLLPSAVVAEAVDERAAEIEDREARDVGRAERRRLREEVLVEMLPRAFTRSRQVRAYVDGVAGLLVIDAASDKAAEELVSLLRETLGTLRARPPRPVRQPVSLMTAWVNGGELPEGLLLGDECELRDARDERSVVRCRGQDLAGEEISTHLRAGKEVVKLALDWQERLSFVLQDDLSLKRLRFADALVGEANEPQIEDPAARFDAEFAIMALELRGLLDRFQTLFGVGGEAL